MDILKQAEKIARRYDQKKPEGIRATDDDWLLAKPETRELLIQVRELKKTLEDAYCEAVRFENWHLALLLYQRLTGDPFLFCLDPTLYSEAECRKNETEFISLAREWLADVEDLLN